jgi:predicted 3-demethylubiquinone-9 3-methyltransferase (glyoxalase superfamily)
MAKLHIAPCLWFDSQAEEAAKYYVGIFPNSKILKVSHYGEEGKEIHKRPAGSVLTVDFQLDGHRFTALNGGPLFKFTEAVSMEIICETQEEIDRLWEKLTAGGDPKAQRCGWLKDRFGLSWQVVPAQLAEMIGDQNTPGEKRAMRALLGMNKLDLEALKKAYAGVA